MAANPWPTSSRDARNSSSTISCLPPIGPRAAKGCSFWADNFNGIDIHLAHRDVTLLAISSAPLEKINAYKQRMGWSFKWVSSAGCDFNHNYHVTFARDEIERGDIFYNYTWTKASDTERPGISVFYKAEDGTLYHTYSIYARGLDMMNTAYHYLDLVLKDRDEAGLRYPMEWLRWHDKYED
jgi:predicted dithiol-disulfide oxidoreductase (DUF899 family)